MPKVLHKDAAVEGEIQEDSQLIERVEEICKNKNPFEHIEAMDYPRMAGSEGEKRGAEYIEAKFREYGLDPQVEKFYLPDPSGFSKMLVPIGFIIWGMLSYITVMLTSGFLEILFAVVVLIVPILMLFVLLKLEIIFKRIIKRNWKKIQEITRKIGEGIYQKPIKQGRNIYVEYIPEQYTEHLYLTAHYDSTTLKLNMKAIKWCMFFGMLGGLVYIFGYIAHYFIAALWDYGLFQEYPVVFLVCLVTFLVGVGLVLFGRAFRTNKSHGAIDNLTGIALILELARIALEIKPHLRITFIAFSAEEIGFFGSIAHYNKHEIEFNTEDLHVVSIDMIGEIPPLTFVEKIKPVFSIPLNEQFNTALIELGQKLGIETKLGMFAYPGSDFANWFLNGFRTNWVMTPSKLLHSAQDIAENVNQELVDQCLKIFTAYFLEKPD